jgi:hypothetical protein
LCFLSVSFCFCPVCVWQHRASELDKEKIKLDQEFNDKLYEFEKFKKHEAWKKKQAQRERW